MDAAERFFEGLRKALLSAEGAGPVPEGLRAAGVLIPLRCAGGEIRVVLARRTERVPHHKGQICFPGGSRDPGDSDLFATALREAQEELGIRPGDVELIGAMEPVPTVTGFFIQPFVGRIPADSPFVADDFEIADIFEAPLSAFTDFSRYRGAETTFRGKPYHVYFLDYGHYAIWGATAGILRRLAEIACGLPPCGTPGLGGG
jgi:8-oxo-dGTP pyrophosphatase MutT (NUDIX family)